MRCPGFVCASRESNPDTDLFTWVVKGFALKWQGRVITIRPLALLVIGPAGFEPAIYSV